jgi:hypothetical protein
MHPLVLGLVQQLANPALILADMAHRFEVLQQPSDHARHGSHGFQNDRAMAIALGEKRIGKDAHEFHDTQRDPVVNVARAMVHLERRAVVALKLPLGSHLSLHDLMNVRWE